MWIFDLRQDWPQIFTLRQQESLTCTSFFTMNLGDLPILSVNLGLLPPSILELCCREFLDCYFVNHWHLPLWISNFHPSELLSCIFPVGNKLSTFINVGRKSVPFTVVKIWVASAWIFNLHLLLTINVWLVLMLTVNLWASLLWIFNLHSRESLTYA